AMDNPARAFESFERALAIQRKLAKENLSTPKYQSAVAGTVRRRGVMAQKFGRTAEAVADYRQSINLLEGLAKPEPGELYNLACSQSLLSGAAGLPGSGLTAADAESEAVKALATLRRAIAAGWNDAAQLRIDTDLAPIRPRPDFQKLQADLEAKQPV